MTQVRLVPVGIEGARVPPATVPDLIWPHVTALDQIEHISAYAESGCLRLVFFTRDRTCRDDGDAVDRRLHELCRRGLAGWRVTS